MTIEAIREAVNAEPFKPFRLRLAGGPAVTVQHPDYIALGPKGRTVIVYQPDESYKVLDTFLISELEHPAKKMAGR
jgi:hypothetical protein